jgi:hypothetical protein
MAAIKWIDFRGQKFTSDEAREASDFHEIVINFDIEPRLIFDIFADESMSVAKRLVAAEMVPLDCASNMLMKEPDFRIRAVIQDRIRESKHL